MSIKPSSLLPNLIESVFENIRKRLEGVEEKNLTDEELHQLHSLFGDTLERALEILDNSKIVLYKSEGEIRELLEVTGTNKKVYKLFPHVNYCQCESFKFQVLKFQSKYTCKHVLATKLALLCNKFEIRILTDSQFSFLLKQTCI